MQFKLEGRESGSGEPDDQMCKCRSATKCACASSIACRNYSRPGRSWLFRHDPSVATRLLEPYESWFPVARDELLSSSKAGDELDFALDLPITYEELYDQCASFELQPGDRVNFVN